MYESLTERDGQMIVLILAIANVVVGILNIPQSEERSGWICSILGWLTVIVVQVQLMGWVN